MKKALSIVLAVVLLVSAVALVSCGKKADTPTLKVYTNAGFAPYEYVDESGKVVGVDIDVMNYIGEKLGYKVVINDIEFKAILNEVQKDEFAVGAAGMSKNDERDAVALASEIYATSVQYVIAPAGTFAAGAVVSIADVVAYAAEQGKAIGDQEATTGSFLVEDAVADTDVQQVDYTNAIVATTDIGTTLAAVVIDKLPAVSICSDKAALECWELDEEPESYVLYFNKNATELVKKVNEILKDMIADGTIDQFTVKHTTGK